jgi:hypothetical protein
MALGSAAAGGETGGVVWARGGGCTGGGGKTHDTSTGGASWLGSRRTQPTKVSESQARTSACSSSTAARLAQKMRVVLTNFTLHSLHAKPE